MSQAIELQSNKSATINFNMEIEGAKGDNTEIRFIIETNSTNYMFPCEWKNGNLKVEIPALKEAIESGTHEYKIEVIIEENYYKPLKGIVNVTRPVEIKISEAKTEIVKKEKKIKINVDLTKVEESSCDSIAIPVKKKKNIKKDTKKNTKILSMGDILESV